MAYWLILAFPVLLLTVKPLSIIIFVLLVFIGGYIISKEKINPLTYPPLRLFSWLTLGYFAVMTLSVVFSHEIGNDWRHLSRISYFLFAPLVGVALVYAEVPAKKMLYHFKLGVLVAGLIALGDYIFSNGSGRFSGMYNPNTFGDIAVVMLFVALSDVWNEDTGEYRWSLAAVVAGVTAVALSGSRGSMLAMILLIPVLLWLAYRNGQRFQRAFVASLLMIFVLGSNLFLTKTATARIANIDHEIHRQESGVGQRLHMYKAGWKAFLDAPVIGHGYRNANYVASQYIDDKGIASKIRRHSHLHNELITHMVNAGVFGVLAYIGILLVPLLIWRRKYKANMPSNIGFLLIFGYIFLGLTHGMFGYEYEGALFVLMLGYSMCWSYLEKRSSFGL